MIVLAIGLSVGALGSWFMVHARPVPGPYIDAMALPDGGAVVVRHEKGTGHAFLEVRGPDKLRWRGLIPSYAGAPGTLAIAASGAVTTVRVVRGGHPHLFAFSTATGDKIASFDLADDAPWDAKAYTLPGLATVNGGNRSVEVLARPGGGARLILVELYERRLAWKVDLAKPPQRVWIAGDAVIAETAGVRSAWAVPTGAPMPAPDGAAPSLDYHRAAGRLWRVSPDKLEIVDDATGAVTATIKD